MAVKIAIVEDDRSISQMYQLKFKAEGYDVEVAHNGALGLVLVKKFQPDVILLDIMMPEMNGDEMLKKIREEPWGNPKKLKVVVLTNIGEDEVPESLKKLGVSKIVMKAYHTPAQVVSLVEEVLA